MSKRGNILSAVASAIASTTGIASGSVFRSRVTALQRAECPSLNLQPVIDSANRQTINHLMWELTFHIDVIVRAESGDVAADPIIADMHSKLMSNAIVQGLVVDIVPGQTTWEFAKADKDLCVASVQYKVTYQTAENALT